MLPPALHSGHKGSKRLRSGAGREEAESPIGRAAPAKSGPSAAGAQSRDRRQPGQGYLTAILDHQLRGRPGQTADLDLATGELVDLEQVGSGFSLRRRHSVAPDEKGSLEAQFEFSP